MRRSGRVTDESDAISYRHSRVPVCARLHTHGGAGKGQSYPLRNVQMIVPYPAGGSIDLYARAVSLELAKSWGRNVIVDNRPGASGMIGTEAVTRMDPDGHVHAARPHLLIPGNSGGAGQAAVRSRQGNRHRWRPFCPRADGDRCVSLRAS